MQINDYLTFHANTFQGKLFPPLTISYDLFSVCPTKTNLISSLFFYQDIKTQVKLYPFMNFMLRKLSNLCFYSIHISHGNFM